MNFDFSAEQLQLRHEARRFLQDCRPPSAVRAVLEGPEPYDRALWAGVAEMGFLGAERVLGLPGDIRVDKALPFNEIPTSGRIRPPSQS